MKQIKSLSESNFLKLFFLFFSFVFVASSVFMPDVKQLLPGTLRIITQPGKISTNYFALGGYGATLFNMGMVGFAFSLLFISLDAKVNNVSTLALILTMGFSSWGINILNIWPTVLGVALYCAVKKQPLAANANAMLFSTGIAPLISDLLLRYPGSEVVGFNLLGIALAAVVGLLIGFTLPAGLANAPKVHHGLDLYSAAVPVCMMAFFLQTVLYKTPGVALPDAPAAETLKVASRLNVNVFCIGLFTACILIALLMGCKVKDYLRVLKEKKVGSLSAAYGNEVFLMNVGVYGLFILAYYNLIGATFNGVTFGVIFCMLACCNSGSTPATVCPIMLGYVLGSALFGAMGGALGGNFTFAVNAQAIVVGLCFANGLSPICAKHGWIWGTVSAVMHYCLVTSIPLLHGGFCLYNGGFTAALVCLLLVPIIECFAKEKAAN